MQGPFTKGIEEKEILLNLDYWEEVRDTYLAKKNMYLYRQDVKKVEFCRKKTIEII